MSITNLQNHLEQLGRILSELKAQVKTAEQADLLKTVDKKISMYFWAEIDAEDERYERERKAWDENHAPHGDRYFDE